MSNAADRLSKLEATAQAEQESLKKGIRNTLITFSVLAVIVFAYSAFAFHKINNYVGPKGLKEYGELTVNILEDQPGRLLRKYDANKEEWAELVVTRALDATPEVENFLKNQMTLFADDLNVKMKKEFLPNMATYIRESAPQMKADYAAAKKLDKDLTPGKFLCDMYIQFLDREIKAKVIDFDAAEVKANEMSKAIYNLHKGTIPLTKREVAERKILINFVIIARLSRVSDSPILADLKAYFRKRTGVTMSQLTEDKVLDEVEDGHKSEPITP